MYKITEELATHGLGGFYVGDREWMKIHGKTGQELEINGERWLIADVRDMNDGANPLYVYVQKVGMIRRCFEWSKFKNCKGVVICCSAGQSRSNSIAMAYLIDKGMEFEDARALVEKNPICNIDPDLIGDIRLVFPHTYTGKRYD